MRLLWRDVLEELGSDAADDDCGESRSLLEGAEKDDIELDALGIPSP